MKVYRSVKEGRGKEKKERYEEEGTGGVRQGIGGWERGDKEWEGKGRRRREVWTPALTPIDTSVWNVLSNCLHVHVRHTLLTCGTASYRYSTASTYTVAAYRSALVGRDTVTLQQKAPQYFRNYNAALVYLNVGMKK